MALWHPGQLATPALESLPQTAAGDQEPLCSIATEALYYLTTAPSFTVSVKRLKKGPAGHSSLKGSHGKQLKESKLFSFFKVLFYSRYMYCTKKIKAQGWSEAWVRYGMGVAGYTTRYSFNS